MLIVAPFPSLALTVRDRRHGWGSASHTSVGVIARIDGAGVTVNFREHEGWSGVLSELQSASLSEGDSVAVCGNVDTLRSAFRDSPLTLDDKKEGVRPRDRGSHSLACLVVVFVVAVIVVVAVVVLVVSCAPVRRQCKGRVGVLRKLDTSDDTALVQFTHLREATWFPCKVLEPCVPAYVLGW